MKRVPVPTPPGYSPSTNSVLETAHEALIKQRDRIEDMIDTFRPYVHDNDLAKFRDRVAAVDTALAWLNQLPEQLASVCYLLENSLDEYNETLPETQKHLAIVRALMTGGDE